MRLWCTECDRPSGPEAKGWRLYRVEDPDEEGEEILAAYCRACAVTAFGPWAERSEAD